MKLDVRLRALLKLHVTRVLTICQKEPDEATVQNRQSTERDGANHFGIRF